MSLVDAQTKQEVVKTSIANISEKNPMLSLFIVLLLSGGVSSGATLFGTGDLDKRVAEIEKVQMTQTMSIDGMKDQQSRLDRTLDNMNATLIELNKTVAVMNVTIEGLKEAIKK